MPRKVRGARWTVPGRRGSGGLGGGGGGGGAAAYLSQEEGVHSKQLMHWRVKAPQLALMMQSGREEEGPEVLVESAPTHTQSTRSLPPRHSGPFRPANAPTPRTVWTTHSLQKLLACTRVVVRRC